MSSSSLMTSKGLFPSIKMIFSHTLDSYSIWARELMNSGTYQYTRTLKLPIFEVLRLSLLDVEPIFDLDIFVPLPMRLKALCAKWNMELSYQYRSFRQKSLKLRMRRSTKKLWRNWKRQQWYAIFVKIYSSI